MPAITTEEPFFTLSPDWVCEVLSPRTQVTDRAKKLPIYAREAVSHVWLVDVRAEPFAAIELDLAILWADVVLGSESELGRVRVAFS